MQHILQFLAGLGLFLYAMYLLEESLKKLAGRSFKLFLRKHTTNTLEAVGSSALVTGVLQSSSVVIMMILAFVGAGIVSMRNALAVVIGSNFGTTLSSWMVATLGFQIDVATIALPLITLSCITLVFTDNRNKLYQYGLFTLGFGFLFLGLEYMKISMATSFNGFDISQYSNYPPIVFVVLGFVLTAVIQSSSATMAILLSALHTGKLPFEIAAATVIGSELGTTVKIVISALTGVAAKRQLAIGNVLFNAVITIVALVFLRSFCELTTIVGKDDLLRLVFFQSAINLAGVFLFFPFLNSYARLLERYIKGKVHPATFVIDSATLASPELAIDAFNQDTQLLILRVLRLNLSAFAIEKKIIHAPHDINITLKERNRKLRSYEDRYEDLKRAEGEVLIYSMKLIDRYPEQHQRVNELVSAVRYAMHSGKAMKDVQHNRVEFRESGNDTKHNYYNEFKAQLEQLYGEIDGLIAGPKASVQQQYNQLFDRIYRDYFSRQEKIYDAAHTEKLTGEDISSLLNINRELYTSCKTIVLALRLYHSGDHKAYKFEEFP